MTWWCLIVVDQHAEMYFYSASSLKQSTDNHVGPPRHIILNQNQPPGFFIWGYMYPFTVIFGGTSKFLGVQSLTLHLGVQRKLTAFSPRKVAHHAGFCKYYAELAKTFFFCLTLGVGFSLTHGLCVCLTIFCNIVYNLSNFVFYTELNARLPIYSHDH